MPGENSRKKSIRSLYEPVTGIKGIGEKSAQLFHRCGVHTVEELLYYFPRDFDEYEEPSGIKSAGTGKLCSVRARLKGGVAGRYVRNLHISTFRIEDDEGESVSRTSFNMPYLRNVIRSGTTYIFRGVIRHKGNRLVMDQPKVFGTEEYDAMAGTMQPRYPLVKGLTNNAVIKAVRQALPMAAYLEDILGNDEKRELGLSDIGEAVRNIHFPEGRDDFIRARDRIAFDELLIFMVKLRSLRRDTR